jgi:hypothetical protein
VRHVKDLPVNVDYFLVQAGNEMEALAAPKFAPRRRYGSHAEETLKGRFFCE